MSKAKRKITEFNFEEDGAHVALVDKAANEQEVLVMKSKHASEEEIQKAVDVNIKLPLMEFLTRYLYLDIDSAEVIAGMLGYSFEDLYEEEEISDFKDMVQRNLDKVTVSNSPSKDDEDDDDETSRVKRQQQTEEFINSFSDFDSKYFVEKNSQSSAASQDEDVVKAEDKETKRKKSKEEDDYMSKETDVQKSDLEIELQKAQEQLADLQKAKEEADQLKEEKANLEKSFKEVNDTVAVLKAAEEKRKETEYLAKAKEHSLVVTDDNPAEELAKALRVAEETEGCEALVKAFESYRDMASKGDALEEIGKSKTDDQPTGTKLDATIEKAMEEHKVDYMKALDIVQKQQPELFAEEYKF